MTREYTFTEETEITMPDSSVQDVHLQDLSFILDMEMDGDEVIHCEIDLEKLVQAMTVFSSMEQFEYEWRSFDDLSLKPTDIEG